MRKSKQILAISLCLILVLGLLSSLTMASASLYPGVVGLSRKAAAEGIVMLKNDNDILPLDPSRTVSLFGRCQINYFLCGYGSGGDVKYPYSTNLLTAMRRNPAIDLYEPLAGIYEAWCATNKPNDGSWGSWPTSYPEMPLTDAQVTDAAENSDTAVVVIGRSAGEDRESTVTEGSFLLTQAEIEMLNKVTAAFDEVVVLLNVGNIIDMSWVDTYGDGIDSILYVWQGGMESGSAVADVLSGDETPSGKMAATIAKTRGDYPSAANFGKSNFNNYAEDIFVGYRYFETFAPDKVMYGFGYGLSYTNFDIATNAAAVVGDMIVLDVTVTNTGTVKGKEVVQVYYGAPQGEMGKAAKSLVAYAKTNLLQPGGSENITISFRIDSMASYDDAGYTPYKSAWVLEAGDYPIYVGNSVRDSSVVYTHNEPATRVVEQLEEAGAVWPGDQFERFHAYEAGGDITLTTDMTPVRTADLAERVQENLPAEYPRSGTAAGLKLMDVYNGDATMAEFIDQMSLQELADLTRGAGPMGEGNGIPGNASVHGGVTAALRDTYGIPPISATDGPSGIRMVASATLLPIGTTLACTWNDRLVEELYAGVGAEMVSNGSDVLLAPGMNLQRDPLCGRNFEYFSEDPLLTGQMGANVVRGVQSEGVSATPKHFALNNQETDRNFSDSRVSERALRELYLKGFEICVKTAKPQNIMTSYNIANGTYAHFNYDLATTILRDQWGFDGCVMTDWWMHWADGGRNNQKPYPYGDNLTAQTSGNARRIRAQVDVVMPGDDQSGGGFGNPAANISNGSLTLGELQRSAVNVLNFALISAKFRTGNGLPLYAYTPGEPAFLVDQAVVTDPKLTGIFLDGEPLSGFHPLTREYTFFARNMSILSDIVVSAAAEDGVTVDITQPTPDVPCATIRAGDADGNETIYRVFWTSQAGMTPTVPNPVYARLSSLSINGVARMDFYRDIYSYDHWCMAAEKDDVSVTYTTPPGVDVSSITRAGDTIKIRVESDDQAMEYFVNVKYYEDSNYPRSDEFLGATLQSFWHLGSPNASTANIDATQDDILRITSMPDDWYGANNPAGTQMNPVAWQYAAGDWTSITKLSLDQLPFTDYQQIGVMMFDDAANWLQLRLGYNHWTSGRELNVTLAVETNDANTEWSPNPAVSLPAAPADIWFKIVKSGDVYTCSYSTDGVNYSAAQTRTLALTNPKFGLFAVNPGTASTIGADFQYVSFALDKMPKSDDFEDAGLKDFWHVDKPSGAVDDTNPGFLRVTSTDGDWYQGADTIKNIVWQYAFGDWTSVTEIALDQMPGQNYQQIGVMVFDDEKTWIQYRIGFNSWEGRPLNVTLGRQENNDNPNINLNSTSLPVGADPKIWLKVVKAGDTYTCSYSLDGVNYSTGDSVTQRLTDPKFGLFAINPGTSATLVCDYMDVMFTDVSYPQPELPVINAPVVNISAAGATRVKLAADNFFMTSGLGTENTGDTDGGKNIGWTTAGQYLLVNLNVETAGNYSVTSRYAANAAVTSSDQISYSLRVDGEPAATFTVRGTGGWQNWATSDAQVIQLDAGLQKLMFYCETGGFNANWLEFTRILSVETIPNATIDYINEQLTGLADGAYTFNGTALTVTGGAAAIPADWLGQNVVIVKKGDGTATTDSIPQTLAIPGRPAAPAPGKTNCTTEDNDDGAITGLTPGTVYEYKKDAAATYITAAADEDGAITGLAPGSYAVRAKAVADSAFASPDAAAVIIGAYAEAMIYTISFNANNGSGTMEADTVEAGANYTIKANSFTRSNYSFTGWNTAADGTGTAYTAGATITDIQADITLYAQWQYISGGDVVTPPIVQPDTTLPETDPPPTSNLLPFTDVGEDDWFYDAVAYVFANGLMIGTSEDQFSPDMPLTRGMLAMILYRLEEEPDCDADNPYPDVADQYYADAAVWAHDFGIMLGYANGFFGGDDILTREQLVTVLYRYAEAKGLDVDEKADLSGYTDLDSVSDWARDAMEWAVTAGIIKGRTETTIVPQGQATRAEVAMIFMRYIEGTIA